MKLEGWNVIDEEAGVLWREYVFSKGAYATTLVFRGVDGDGDGGGDGDGDGDGLVVVSPATGLGAREYDALREFGEVRALIANNSFHHMGQPAWRAHFPEAVSYCPPRAVEVLAKKAPGVSFQSLASLKLPERVHWDDPPGFKTGEALLSIATSKGSVWYSGDLLTNIQKTPGPPFSWIFSWFDAAPGFRLFKPGVWLLVKDKKAVRQWALDHLARNPPAIVVPAHGPPVDASDVAALARAQIERL